MSARVVHKYPIDEPGWRTALDLPEGSKVAYFAEQTAVLTVWIDRPADLDLPTQWLELVVVGTGHPTPEGDWQHHGTALVAGGRFVFHLYGRTRA